MSFWSILIFNITFATAMTALFNGRYTFSIGWFVAAMVAAVFGRKEESRDKDEEPTDESEVEDGREN